MPDTSSPKPIHKKLVTDEQHRPVAVQIDYKDWLEIERRLGLTADAPAAATPPQETGQATFDRLLDDTSGIWTEGDGLEYQRRIRGEWTRPWDPEAQEGE